ncbi:MAG: hypothetical protein HY334_08235 [Armatimonadetes bacterium]|nr:hypothetical protein [Armatimonadota bacterium]
MRDAVTVLFDHAAAELEGRRYCFVGTAAAVIRGVPIRAGDVDILFEKREGVDLVARALKDFPCVNPPAWLPEAGQYFASFDVRGAQVEVSTVEWTTESDCSETLGAGPYTHYVLIRFGRHAVPTIKLELRLATELARGRDDRYVPLVEWMRRHGCDLALLRRAMEAAQLPDSARAWVLDQITEKS